MTVFSPCQQLFYIFILHFLRASGFAAEGGFRVPARRRPRGGGQTPRPMPLLYSQYFPAGENGKHAPGDYLARIFQGGNNSLLYARSLDRNTVRSGVCLKIHS
jgi:hypothetical protein